MPTDTLQSTLATLMASGRDDNPALNALLSAYARFHLVVAVVGALFLLALGPFSVFCWRRFRRSAGTFERRTYLWFGVIGSAASLFLAVVVAANVDNTVNPRPGFAGSFGLIGSPPALQESFTTWLRSGRPERPALVSQAIHDRLAWQLPKAVICAVLLALLVWVGVVVWRTLIRRSRGGVLLVAGVATVPVGLLLMLMVMGNAQASVVPIAPTLLFG